MAPTGPITADWVHNVLFWRLTVHEWKLLDEVAAREEIAGPRGRRIDVLVVRAPSRPEHGLFERLALEIKCSRGDFLSDVRDPGKQAPWRALTMRVRLRRPGRPHRPPRGTQTGSGLMEVHTMRFQRAGWQTPVLRWAVHPPANQPGPVPDWLAMELIYRASYLDVHTKRQLHPGLTRSTDARRHIAGHCTCPTP